MKIILFLSISVILMQVANLSCSVVDNKLASADIIEQAQNNTVHKLIEQFRSSKGDKLRIDETVHNFTTLSSKSSEFRKEAIQQLLRIAYEFRDAKNNDQYYLWLGAVKTLGELKAVEAINVLGDCFNCNNLISGYVLERYPSAYALTKIGTPAVPKLLQILTQTSEGNEANRAIAVLALSRINEIQPIGVRERKILKELLKVEKNGLIVEMIREIVKND